MTAERLTNGEACLAPMSGAVVGFGPNGFVGVTIFCCGSSGVCGFGVMGARCSSVGGGAIVDGCLDAAVVASVSDSSSFDDDDDDDEDDEDDDELSSSSESELESEPELESDKRFSLLSGLAVDGSGCFLAAAAAAAAAAAILASDLVLLVSLAELAFPAVLSSR